MTNLNSNNLLSDELKVDLENFTEPVTYKLVTVGNIDVTSESKRAGHNSAVYRPGEVTIFDKGDKQQPLKVLRNVISSYSVVNDEGKQYTREEIEEIYFGRSGLMTVHPSQPNTYVFMERHPENGSNPFRDKRIPVLFERVDPTLIERTETFYSECIYEAEKMIREMAWKEIAASAPAMGIDVDKDPDYVVAAMVSKIKKGADAEKFLLASTDSKIKAKTVIGRAIVDQKLSYSVEKKAWVKKSGEVITTLQEGKNKWESMFAFLATEEGKAYFQTIKK